MNVFIHPLVQQDYDKALYYYEEESLSLARRFETAIRHGLERIVATPTAFPYHLKQQVYRRYKLDRFPYLIVYRLTEDEISIVTIKHEKQRPTFGLSRL